MVLSSFLGGAGHDSSMGELYTLVLSPRVLMYLAPACPQYQSDESKALQEGGEKDNGNTRPLACLAT